MTQFQILIVGVLSFLSGWGLSLFLMRKLFALKDAENQKLKKAIQNVSAARRLRLSDRSVRDKVREDRD